MSFQNDTQEIPVRRLNIIRVELEESPVGPPEDRELGYVIESEEKPVGLGSNGPKRIIIPYSDL